MGESEAVAARTAGVNFRGTGSSSYIRAIAEGDVDDYLHGADIVGAFSFLAGFGGDNTLDGGEGIGVADYSATPLSLIACLNEGVFVASLLASDQGKVTIANPFGGVDTLVNIKGIAGTNGSDDLTGSADADYFWGNGGNDRIDGGEGRDWISYSGDPSGVFVNLRSHLARDGWNVFEGECYLGGQDALFNIENVEGSVFDDQLNGDYDDNALKGLSGDDVLDGSRGADTAIYRGLKSDYVITKLEDGSYTIRDTVSGRDGTDTVSNVEFLKFSDKIYDITNLGLEKSHAGSDVNGDDHSDILLQNAANGACYVWQMDVDGLTIKAGGFIGGYDGPGAKWQLKATGDFDGDGKSDLLLQYAESGACYIWQMDGQSIKAGGFIGGYDGPGAKWQVKGAGDFDGDGKSDILLQSADTGAVYVWEMGDGGLTIKAGGFIGGYDGPGAKWQVKGIGDFNGDGNSDILLQYADTGAVYVWEMGDTGLSIKAGGFVGGYDGPGSKWQVKGVGDFNGDGKSDILLQYADTGAIYVWQMGDDGLTIKAGGFIGGYDGPGSKWQVKGAGDFNGDGKSDILLQYADNGACYVWEMDGNIIKAGGFVGGYDGPGADWHATV